MCPWCWKRVWQGQCFRCQKQSARELPPWGRFCKTCYNHGLVTSCEIEGVCYYCLKTGPDIAVRSCSYLEECGRPVTSCARCCDLKGIAVCSGCFRRDWGAQCFRCKRNKAREEAPYGKFCKACFEIATEAGALETLTAEAVKHALAMKRDCKPTGEEPALQLLVLPRRPNNEWKEYDAHPEYLSPNHCRLCLQSLSADRDPTPGEADSAEGSGDDSVHNGNTSDEEELFPSAVAVSMPSAVAASSTPGEGRRSYGHPDLAKHLAQEHAGKTMQEYRKEVLSMAMTQWPHEVSPQVLRTRLAAYKQHLTDANFAMGTCACCARFKRKIRLQQVNFPVPGQDVVPSWLGYSAQEWEAHGADWLAQVSTIFDVEQYLQTYFEADRQVREAEQELLDFSTNPDGVDRAKKIALAEVWRDRVRKWRANMKSALRADAVLAPGRVDCYWMLYLPDRVAPVSGALGEAIVCKLCRRCRSALQKRDKFGSPRPAMPDIARARGLWGGPEPEEIKVLTFLERRVTQPARVYCVIKRVLGKTVPWAKGNMAAMPQYTTKNTVAYPNDPSSLMRMICLLPEDLCSVFCVQFVSSFEDAYQEPALQVSVARLRAAIWWLASNCWPWMVETKDMEVISQDALGVYLEHIVAAYPGVGVLVELLKTATSLDLAGVPTAREGPDDAVGGAENHDTGAYSSAVIDTGLEELSPLQLWSTAMTKYKVLQECEAVLEALGPDDTSNEREQAVRDETRAIAEAALTLRRMATPKIREELEAFRQERPPRPEGELGSSAGMGSARSVKARVATDLHTFLEGARPSAPILQLRHQQRLLNSFDPNFWACCFVDLFFRGDCKEKYPQHARQLGGKKWIRLLQRRADFRGWTSCKEFAAVVANILMRREQMWAVHRYIMVNTTFYRNLIHYDALTAIDFVAAALASGDCNTVRELMRKKGVELKVRSVLQSMDIALRDVEGSDAERDTFRYKFLGMRVWNGCSFVFFTLNPHDIHSPMLIVFANADNHQMEQVSLDWGDEDMKTYYGRVKKDNALRLHEFAIEHPAAAALCVHLTFRMTLEFLFNCSGPANHRPSKQHADGYPCKCEPGIFNYLAGYMGIVEPQMRWTEHLHMLLQLLGFAHPRDFFRRGRFIDTFRAVWCFVASIAFESQEAFASYLGTDVAMETLQRHPLMELGSRQRKDVGSVRVAESLAAQLQGRGMVEESLAENLVPRDFQKWAPEVHADINVTAEEWARSVVGDSVSGANSCGNHVCRGPVCHKGRLGKMGLCRLAFWSLRRTQNKKNLWVMQRVHGKELSKRWDRKGMPPIHKKPPHRGMPQLERTQPYHFKMSPGPMLGPRCNHGVGIIGKLPIFEHPDARTPAEDTSAVSSGRGVQAPPGGYDAEERPQSLDTTAPASAAESSSAASGVISDVPAVVRDTVACPLPQRSRDCNTEEASASDLLADADASHYVEAFLDRIYVDVGLNDDLAEASRKHLKGGPNDGVNLAWQSAMAEMLEGIVAAEFYASDYVSKDQPHAEGLLHTLHDSMQRAEKFAEGTPQEQDMAARARKLLQRLVAATNRRIHKGFPNIYAYLGQRPNHYASHTFVNFSFGQVFGKFIRVVLLQCQAEMPVDVGAMLQQDEDIIRASSGIFCRQSAFLLLRF